MGGKGKTTYEQNNGVSDVVGVRTLLHKSTSNTKFSGANFFEVCFLVQTLLLLCLEEEYYELE